MKPIITIILVTKIVIIKTNHINIMQKVDNYNDVICDDNHESSSDNKNVKLLLIKHS